MRRAAIALVVVLATGCAMAPAALAGPPLYWSYPFLIDAQAPVNDLSCPSASLCVGVDARGDVVTSTDPTGGTAAWTTTKIDSAPEPPYTTPNALHGVSCPAPAGSLCVATGEGGIFTSSNPDGGAGAWTSAGGVGGGGRAISCRSAALCVAGTGRDGEILVSTDPTGGAGAWKAVQLEGVARIERLSCPTESLCVGASPTNEEVLTSANPTGGAGAWAVTHLPGGLFSVSCPSASVCVGNGGAGVLSSTDPAAGASSWTPAGWPPAGRNLNLEVACASPSLCVAGGADGYVADSANPTGGAAAWFDAEGVDGTESIVSAACASETLCFAANEELVIGIPAHTLSVSLSGAGHGTVTSKAPPCPYGCTYSGPVCPRSCAVSTGAVVPQRLEGISCLDAAPFEGDIWGTCSASLPAVDTVTLTATPESGSTFAGWGGACGAGASCAVNMSSDQVVSATFTPAGIPGEPGSSQPAGATVPRLSDVHQSARRWREGSAAAAVAATTRKSLPRGTVFSFRLDEPAKVTLVFAQPAAGRRVEKACVAQASKHAGSRCVRTATAGTLTVPASGGTDRVTFDGVLPGGRRLTPGAYTVKLTASAAGGRSAPSTLRFAIVKRP